MNIVIKNRRHDIEKLLQQHQSISIMGMPSGGISLFLKLLHATRLGYSVYVDVFGLTSLSATGLLRTTASALGATDLPVDHSALVDVCIAKLQELTKKHQRVTIYFGGFDQLGDAGAIDGELLQSLQALARSCDNRVKLVFGLCTNLKKFIPDANFDSGLRLLGNRYFMGGYTIEELRYLLAQYGPNNWKSTPELATRLKLAGGHLGLLMLLVGSKSEILEDRNEAMNMLFYNMYQQLPAPQRTTVRNIALGRKQPEDEYLSGIGLLQNGKLFSPLFADYVAGLYKERLPVKERRLFLLLKRSLGHVVSKQEIKDIVWQGEIVSDWALNALVYRLRKHPAFTTQNYSIENHKKLGYIMQKSF